MAPGNARRFALAGLLFIGLLTWPLPGFAHGHVNLGIGFGWWGFPWLYPAPWPYYYGPAFPGPVPAPPPCADVWVEGRWERVGKEDAWGFTTYRPQWVPGHWERICP